MSQSIAQRVNLPAEPTPTEQPAGTFTAEQIDIIKNSVAKGVSNDELAYFLEVCRSTGLNPLHRQIYAIVRSGKMTIQTGIDGYRLLATRSRRHAGTDDAQFDTETAPHPAKATVTVYRLVGGQRCPFTATARWSEYAQESNAMWKKMPYLMLGKCGEALALRKAFPAETSGIYTDAEMDQADNMVESMQQVQSQTPEAVVLERIQEFQQIVDSTNPLAVVTHIPIEPTQADWNKLKLRIFKAEMATNPAEYEQLMEQTGGDYEETLAKVDAYEREHPPKTVKTTVRKGYASGR